MVDAQRQRAKREVKASSTTLLVHLLLVALQALVFFDSGQNFLCASRSGPDGPPAREIVTGSRRPVNVGRGGPAPKTGGCDHGRQAATPLVGSSTPPEGFAKLYAQNVTKEFRSGRNPLKWRQPGDGKPRPKTLLSIHSAVSFWHITEVMLFTLAKNRDKFDVIIVDDHSERVNIEAKAAELGVKVLHHDAAAPKGNTYTWNLAWAYFMEHPEYENLIICNNDLLVPDGTVKKLEQALAAGWTWLLPMTSARGTHYGLHRLHDHYPDGITPGRCGENKIASNIRGCASDWTDQAVYFQEVQDILDAAEPAIGGHIVASTLANIPPYSKRGGIPQIMNGYMMALNKERMAKHQFDPGKHLLFNPINKNTGNEDALVQRFLAEGDTTIGVHTGAFVYHFKGYTLFAAKGRDRSKVGESNYNPPGL